MIAIDTSALMAIVMNEPEAEAYGRRGKGAHPAGLNLDDGFAYETAKSRDCPLLFVGEDFSPTDLHGAIQYQLAETLTHGTRKTEAPSAVERLVQLKIFNAEAQRRAQGRKGKTSAPHSGLSAPLRQTPRLCVETIEPAPQPMGRNLCGLA